MLKLKENKEGGNMLSITIKYNGNKYTYPISIDNLKKYSYRDNINDKKELLSFDSFDKDGYEINICENYLIDKCIYEIFFSIANDKKIAGSLNHKTIKNKLFAKIYFEVLKKVLKHKKIYQIVKMIDK